MLSKGVWQYLMQSHSTLPNRYNRIKVNMMHLKEGDVRSPPCNPSRSHSLILAPLTYRFANIGSPPPRREA